jgi:tRNA(fMet)-specific endonuclease VapC
MNKYLLDTDICVSYLRGKYALDETMNSVGYINCFVSEVTIAELIYGAHKSGDFERHKDDVNKIMSITEVIPMFTSFNLYGIERTRLEGIGKIIPDFDLLIATTAVHHNMTLVTNNTKHMTRIENIRLENWTLVGDNGFVN